MRRIIKVCILLLPILLFSGCNSDESQHGQTASESENGSNNSGVAEGSISKHKVTSLLIIPEFSGGNRLQIIPADSAKYITSVYFNGKEGNAVSSKNSVFETSSYYLDKELALLYIWSLKSGDVIMLGAKDGLCGAFECKGKVLENTLIKGNVLHVKLSGAFEAAIVDQRKYDAISGASSFSSSNNNSDVTVLVSYKDNPSENDWEKIESSRNSFSNSKIRIKDESGKDANMGMEGIFVKVSSALRLKGVPTKAGDYKISVELRDNYGRLAVSNELPFSVYARETALGSVLKPGCAKKESWDMKPWSIQKFGNNDKVTVPQDVKRWFGSHKSGTYGVLGYAVGDGEASKQILEVVSEVKLINMMVLSSVNIVVKNGGKLNLQDSSVHGTITVENGGQFQMNYDNYNNQYTSGSQINGSLLLKDGAALEKSLIYSNTNFLPNGNSARHNDDPVVTITGNVRIKGNVYIRGDEAATGLSNITGKLFTGQPAMIVKNGTVIIDSGAELGLYGGGRIATTTEGGAALILENSNVAGNGKLIAIGGSSFGDNGACAVEGKSGKNKIVVKEAYLQGGNTYSKSSIGGQAYQNTITIFNTIGKAKNGKMIFPFTSIEKDQPSYWDDILLPPNTSVTCPTGSTPINKI